MTSSNNNVSVNKIIKESLSKWEELTPLSDQQLRSILLLNQFNQFSQSYEGGGGGDIASSSTVASSASAVVLPDTSDQQQQSSSVTYQINEDINELLYNFDVNDIEDARIERYVNKLNKNLTKTQHISELIAAALDNLGELLANYAQVSTKTKSLHVACEQLISDQAKLVNASFLLNSRLAYFTDMDVFMQKLNSPTIENNCEYIIPMLTRIDECLGYLDANASHKESATYKLIVLHVLRKALHIIKNYTTNSLNTVTNSIMHSMAQEGASSGQLVVKFSADNAYTMFYNKFRVNANRIRTLMEQLEQRLDVSTQPDYEETLHICHQCYIQNRKNFILASVLSAINELCAKYQRDTCTLVRTSCSFMIHLCQDESQLYKNFFGRSSSFFENFLVELCMILYDRLRPIIIHVSHIETLAELCSILKTEILMDNVKQTNADHLSAFEDVCSQMLEDVQERFVYRTHIYIAEEILGYNPSTGDLSYPQKLEIMEQIAENLTKTTNGGTTTDSTATTPASSSPSSPTSTDSPPPLGDNAPAIDSNNSSTSNSPTSAGTAMLNRSKRRVSPADAHGMWYPTLKRTLICLSKLYRCLDKKIFEGLAQETLTMCVQSLLKASETIKKNKTTNDGELFLVKHLLILREQIAPFNNDFSVVEVKLDFTKLKDAAYLLMNNKTHMFRFNRDNAFLDFLLRGTLEAKENVIDSKREVDNQLKRSCETFIDNVASELFGSITDLIKKVNTVLKINTDPNAPKVVLSQQPFAKPYKLHDLFAENYKDLRKKLPLITYSMSLYLANKDVEQILLKRIKNQMQQTYLEMSQIVSKHYSEEDQLIIACPTVEQISLWMTVS